MTRSTQHLFTHLAVFLMCSISFSSFTQTESDNFAFVAHRNSFPGGVSCVQSYTPQRNKVFNTSGCYDGKRVKKKRKTEKNPRVQQAFDFVQQHISDSIYRLELSKFDFNKEDYHFLQESGLIDDSVVLVNFNLFETEFYKVIQDCDSCLPIARLPGRQIDGQRIKLEVFEDTNQLLNVTIGIFEFSDPRSFREWLIAWEICNEFGLFSELQISAYFTRERLSEEMKRYVDELRI